MGSYDGAEIYELVGLFVLDQLKRIVPRQNIDQYRDDGLAVVESTSGPKADKTRKDKIEIFKTIGPKITVEANLKAVKFLDVTLNLDTGLYQPYRKPDDQTRYVHAQSNHPPAITKNLPKSIEQRLSKISSNKEVFEKAAPYYQQDLQDSGYTQQIEYQEERPKRKRNRKRTITRFNPPFSKNVKTDIARKFLKMLDKHFPKKSKLLKIFNRSTVKVSYSTMRNVERIIKNHNNRLTNEKDGPDQRREEDRKDCNCRNKQDCPMDGNCLTESVVYQAVVKNNRSDNTKTYIGLTDGTFKQRFYGHTSSFRHEKQEKSTGLSKYIWQRKRAYEKYSIEWSVLRQAPAYSNITKKCDLCLTEKLMISSAEKKSSLNKRSELVSKCRHENKYLLRNFT